MDTRRDTRSYDLFKLIVTLILLALLILLLLTLRAPQSNTINVPMAANLPAATAAAPTAPAPAAAASATQAPAAETAPTLTKAPTNTAQPTDTPVSTDTPVATNTSAPTATQPPEPTPTQAEAATPTLAPTPAQAEAAGPTPTPTPAEASAPADASGDCALALPARVTVGAKARVLSNLNLRAAASMDAAITRTHPAAAILEITGGPTCTPYGGGAYRWWEVRAPDGVTGWSAEGSATGKNYFLEPVK